MKRKIHVVPHTHWDREWYFTTSRSSVYLMNNVSNILNTLEQDHRFHHYMLDAQGSLLEDYIKWMPQDKERIVKLVQEGRLQIGPWYTQSDQMVISAESIVRNLYYGMKTCEEFGGYMNIAYVPDSFGQAGNMPQIYQEFGIQDTLFWRGVSNDMVKHTDYMWRGDDGSEVFVTQIPYGYYIGGNIPEDKKERNQFWEEVCLKKAGTGATKNIYFPQGFDQAPIRKNLADLIEQRNLEDIENEYVISNIEHYISDVKKENPSLSYVEGELLNAKHMRIHRSIFSSRSDLKQLNTQVQNYVTNIMEPILTMSYHMGNPYPHEAVKEIWKLLFENAAHDSIGSCISDRANEDVYFRYKKAADIAENLVELHERYLATTIKQPDGAIMSFTLFQTLPHKRSDVIVKEIYLPNVSFVLKNEEGTEIPYSILSKEDVSDYVLSQTIRLNPSKQIHLPNEVYRAKIACYIDELPACGYTQLFIYPKESVMEQITPKTKLENEYYQIEIQENGLLKIIDKRNQHVYENQCEFIENGDDGDSFNYSPPREDMLISSANTMKHHEMNGNSFLQSMDIHYEMMVPYDLEQRANGKAEHPLKLQMHMELKKNDPIIYVQVKIENNVYSHRLCVLIDGDMATKINYADEQFGIIRRDNEHLEDMRLYEEALHKTTDKKVVGPLNWVNAEDVWQEPSIAIEPCQSFVALSNDDRSISVFPGGVREYEIVGDQKNKISLTLFRTYGFMGKENLLYRPGRASGEKIIATPDAQLITTLSFDFGFATFADSFNKAGIAQVAKRYQTPVDMYTYADFLNGRLIFVQEDVAKTKAAHMSLMELKEDKFIMSALKKCDDKKGYIIRFYNPFYKQMVSDELKLHFTCNEAYYVDLLEQKKSIPLRFHDDTIFLENIDHCKFISIYVEGE